MAKTIWIHLFKDWEELYWEIINVWSTNWFEGSDFQALLSFTETINKLKRKNLLT